jgi:hypothetical protein
MKKLLKAYNFNSDMQYFEMIVNSFHNGQFTQAYSQFDAMPKANKINFLKSATVGGWSSGLAEHKIANLFERI